MYRRTVMSTVEVLGAATHLNVMVSSHAGSPVVSTPMKQKTKTDSEVSNLKTMPKGLSASLPDLDSESWIEVKKRPRPSPARPKGSTEKVKSILIHSFIHSVFDLIQCLSKIV